MSAKGDAAALWESYQISEHLPQRVIPVGRWTRKKGETKPSRPEGLGQTMKASTPRTSSPSVPKEVETKRKSLKFGVLEAPVDDPLLRRQDLSGLHLTCTSIDVRKNGSLSLFRRSLSLRDAVYESLLRCVGINSAILGLVIFHQQRILYHQINIF